MEDQRICIKFSYGDAVMSRRRVFEWYKRFKEGRKETADNERSGRPSTSTTPEKVTKVLELVREDRRITVREVAEEAGISFGSTQSIMKDILGNARKETASLNLEATTDDPELLKRVITGDETWIYGFDSEATQQASEWRFKNEQRPKKARKAPSKVKVMLTVFFDCQGIVHHQFQQQGSTITADSYLGVLRRLREAIRQKRPELWRSKSWILHHDNAPAHTALKISKFLQDHSTSVFPQPPYSPDLVPCDFFLFGKLKKSNEFADRLAKAGCLRDRSVETPVTKKEVYRRIRGHVQDLWLDRWRNSEKGREVLNWVTYTQVPLSPHGIKLKINPDCVCGERDVGARHYVLDCTRVVGVEQERRRARGAIESELMEKHSKLLEKAHDVAAKLFLGCTISKHQFEYRYSAYELNRVAAKGMLCMPAYGPKGRISIEDEHRPGRPVESVTQGNIDKIHVLVMLDRIMTVRRIEETLGILKTTVDRIMREHLGHRKLSARWVLKLLIPDQKAVRRKLFSNNLALFEANPEEFVSRFVTMDETWVHHFTPEAKQQSMQWRYSDSEGVLLLDFLNKDQTITGNYYANLVKQLRGAIKEKRRRMLSRKIVYHQDNAPSHRLLQAMATIYDSGFEPLPHAPYSPDLAPSNFHL
ncbi:hypothetical protein LAZ67_12001525 [Cordylochernes scorpioides]|uniref:Transposase n=1 Tax=Cordylochernes scorpioides TaxID=51811 RepID=A0ABY6L613_9ARAC|nr:hypothetical protein LAZ67_12001525 [Cordylochernes scorpioides]